MLTSAFSGFEPVISSMNMACEGTNLVTSLSGTGRQRSGRSAIRARGQTGITAAEMAPMLRPDRRTRARGRYNTEAMEHDGNTVYVGIERVHRIVRFDFGKDGLLARGRPIEVPAAFHAYRATAASRRSPSCRAALRRLAAR